MGCAISAFVLIAEPEDTFAVGLVLDEVFEFVLPLS